MIPMFIIITTTFSFIIGYFIGNSLKDDDNNMRPRY